MSRLSDSTRYDTARSKAETLMEALPWIQRYAGSTMVFKYGGNAMINDDLRRAFFGAPPVVWALLVERDGVPLGYAAWTFRFRMYSGRSLMHATTVFVEEAARGQGIGRAISELVLDLGGNAVLVERNAETLAATAAGWSGLALMGAAWARAPRAPRLARRTRGPAP